MYKCFRRVESEARAVGEATARTTEVAEVKQLLEDYKPRIKSLEVEARRLEVERDEARRELEQARENVEVLQYRALDAERKRWEEREQRLLAQVREERRGMWSQVVSGSAGSGESRLSSPSFPLGDGPAPSGVLVEPRPFATTEPHPPAAPLPTAMFAQQIPPIPTFTGEEQADEGDSFQACSIW